MSALDDKFVHLTDIIPKDLTEIIKQYCLFRMLNNSEYQQNSVSRSVYADSLMETLLIYIKPAIEAITSIQLIPTYSEYRIYKPGDMIEDHIDGPSCQVSLALTIGYKYNDKNNDYRNHIHTFVDGRKTHLECEPGNGILYRGNESEFGMDPLDAGEDSYLIRVFLHYIDANGPYAKEHKYDGRPGIGCIKK